LITDSQAHHTTAAMRLRFGQLRIAAKCYLKSNLRVRYEKIKEGIWNEKD